MAETFSRPRFTQGGPSTTKTFVPGGPVNIYDGKRMRKAIQRKTVDHYTTMFRYLEHRKLQTSVHDLPLLEPDSQFTANLIPALGQSLYPMTSVTTKYIHSSMNKQKCPINCVRWTPEGRRIITGGTTGEFTLWNGLTFNFETILQAHDKAVRAMRWSHNDTWMISSDDMGVIKYWQSSMNNLKAFQAHKDIVRDLSFSPMDTKFASCSDDGTIKIWNFLDATEERVLSGHGWDVKCIDWHPTKGILASGSKDNLVKLWDPKTGRALTTLHGHKNTILGLQWNQNGNWLLTGARDQLVRVYDIRTMKELQTFRGHKREVTSIAWHPIHENLFVSGSGEGGVMFWNVGADQCVGGMEAAHDGPVWSFDWHPLGHILVSGSNDYTTRFWTRNRPGDKMRDRFDVSRDEAEKMKLGIDESEDEEEARPIPGMGQPAAMSVPGLGSDFSREVPLDSDQPRHKRARVEDDRKDRRRDDRRDDKGPRRHDDDRPGRRDRDRPQKNDDRRARQSQNHQRQGTNDGRPLPPPHFPPGMPPPPFPPGMIPPGMPPPPLGMMPPPPNGMPIPQFPPGVSSEQMLQQLAAQGIPITPELIQAFSQQRR